MDILSNICRMCGSLFTPESSILESGFNRGPTLRQRSKIMTIERFMVEDELPPVSHYCHSVKADNHIWVSGIVGMKADGTIPEDTVSQFDIAINSMDACLRAAGGRPEHIVKVQVFMTDISERAAINPRRVEYFGEHRPASTLVEVSALVDPRMKVEIECQAVLPKVE